MSTTVRSFCILRRCFVLLAALGFAAPASALSVLPDPLEFDLVLGGTENLTGRIDFLGMTTGLPTGGMVLDGAVGAGDTTLIFSLEIDESGAGPVFSTNFRFLSGNPTVTGVGTIPGMGIDVVSGSLGGLVEYDPPGVGDGEASDAWFISATGLGAGEQIPFEFVVIPLGSVTTVPEPGTGLLLMLVGLGLLATRGAARRRL